MIDIALLNSCIIAKLTNEEAGSGGFCGFRFNFMQEVGYELLVAYIKVRMAGYSKLVTTAPDDTGRAMEIKPKKSSKCICCSRSSDKKTTQRCTQCNLFICRMHCMGVIQWKQCSNK